MRVCGILSRQSRLIPVPSIMPYHSHREERRPALFDEMKRGSVSSVASNWYFTRRAAGASRMHQRTLYSIIESCCQRVKASSVKPEDGGTIAWTQILNFGSWPLPNFYSFCLKVIGFHARTSRILRCSSYREKNAKVSAHPGR